MLVFMVTLEGTVKLTTEQVLVTEVLPMINVVLSFMVLFAPSSFVVQLLAR